MFVSPFTNRSGRAFNQLHYESENTAAATGLIDAAIKERLTGRRGNLAAKCSQQRIPWLVAHPIRCGGGASIRDTNPLRFTRVLLSFVGMLDPKLLSSTLGAPTEVRTWMTRNEEAPSDPSFLRRTDEQSIRNLGLIATVNAPSQRHRRMGTKARAASPD
jgi:hypothetical protein